MCIYIYTYINVYVWDIEKQASLYTKYDRRRAIQLANNALPSAVNRTQKSAFISLLPRLLLSRSILSCCSYPVFLFLLIILFRCFKSLTPTLPPSLSTNLDQTKPWTSQLYKSLGVVAALRDPHRTGEHTARYAPSCASRGHRAMAIGTVPVYWRSRNLNGVFIQPR